MSFRFRYEDVSYIELDYHVRARTILWGRLESGVLLQGRDSPATDVEVPTASGVPFRGRLAGFDIDLRDLPDEITAAKAEGAFMSVCVMGLPPNRDVIVAGTAVPAQGR